MERQDYIDQINDLRATNRRLLDMIDTLKQTIDTVSASNVRNEELVRKLTDQIEQLQKMIKNWRTVTIVITSVKSSKLERLHQTEKRIIHQNPLSIQNN